MLTRFNRVPPHPLPSASNADPDADPDPGSAPRRRLGTVPVAAHQVVYQLWIFASFVIDSLAIAGQTLIAIALGAGRPREAREIADRLLEVRPHRAALSGLEEDNSQRQGESRCAFETQK